MKKRVMSVFLVLLLCVVMVLPVSAAHPRLVDEADLLTDDEHNALQALLMDVSNRIQLDVVILTVNTLEGKTPMDYADDYYDANGYGFGAERDGILLLVSMEDRDWWISTSGFAITAFTDAGIEYLSEQFLPYLSSGVYIDAFTIFAEQCEVFVNQAHMGEPFDIGNMPYDGFNPGFTFLLCLAVGFVLALIITGIMRSQLKSVRKRASAADYVKPGSLDVTVSNDLYLYRNVVRVRRETSSSGSGSSTHTSSSGRTHGGGGGKF